MLVVKSRNIWFRATLKITWEGRRPAAPPRNAILTSQLPTAGGRRSQYPATLEIFGENWRAGIWRGGKKSVTLRAIHAISVEDMQPVILRGSVNIFNIKRKWI
ncbi:MAG TPA: hypothetical protein DCE24_02440 [Porphyromonadaceae bacterium]|nr:hypothetical protein [Porphyromonadaceae bacterium]